MAFSSFDRYSYPFNWDEFQRGCQLNQEALISRKLATARWKRLVSREHRRFCDCPDYRFHLFPCWPDPPVAELCWKPKEIPVPRNSGTNLVGFEREVGRKRLRKEKSERCALDQKLEEEILQWVDAGWPIEEEGLPDEKEQCGGGAAAGVLAAGGVGGVQETQFTRIPVIVPSGLPYPLAKGE
jgi:hypothetical protein